jgi:hypothetical protein
MFVSDRLLVSIRLLLEGADMSDNVPATPSPSSDSSANRTGRIVRLVLQWTILGLLAFTVFMAAWRKFGG